MAELNQAATPDEWAAGFGPDGATAAEHSWAARDLLGIDQVTFGLVSVGDAPDQHDGTRSAVLTVDWIAAGAPTQAEVVARVREAAEGGGVDVTGFAAHDGEAMPLWLAGQVEATAAGPVTLYTVDGGAQPEIAALTAVAEAQVTRIAGDVQPAAVIMASSRQTSAALLGRTDEQLASIAGVTARSPGLPVPAVVLNPDQFASMDPRGRQIVVTHELTHAMTGAVGSSAPVWIVEGFADWVALHDDTAPLAVSAGDLLAQVVSDGAPPDTLPTDEEIGQATSAAYQGAWLAMVVLAREHGGDAAVVQVYRAALAGADSEAALAAAGTSTEELTRQWRDYLTYSASTVS
ncbi:MAG: hypothetical protein QM597_05260 [Aeromicrobium sp.]|uniref:hypothetical protein n=1 Tax=Aeromicrobium sp. TaxID=1871063 RepID=UPI0039E5A3D0